ncbi:Uncharacterised protein [uncultured archaeon]|nr:Uncharacterised protein [uncultured archaeon]
MPTKKGIPSKKKTKEAKMPAANRQSESYIESSLLRENSRRARLEIIHSRLKAVDAEIASLEQELGVQTKSVLIDEDLKSQVSRPMFYGEERPAPAKTGVRGFYRKFVSRLKGVEEEETD